MEITFYTILAISLIANFIAIITIAHNRGIRKGYLLAEEQYASLLKLTGSTYQDMLESKTPSKNN